MAELEIALGGFADDARQACLIMRSAGRRDAGQFGIITPLIYLISSLNRVYTFEKQRMGQR